MGWLESAQGRDGARPVTAVSIFFAAGSSASKGWPSREPALAWIVAASMRIRTLWRAWYQARFSNPWSGASDSVLGHEAAREAGADALYDRRDWCGRVEWRVGEQERRERDVVGRLGADRRGPVDDGDVPVDLDEEIERVEIAMADHGVALGWCAHLIWPHLGG